MFTSLSVIKHCIKTIITDDGIIRSQTWKGWSTKHGVKKWGTIRLNRIQAKDQLARFSENGIYSQRWNHVYGHLDRSRTGISEWHRNLGWYCINRRSWSWNPSCCRWKKNTYWNERAYLCSWITRRFSTTVLYQWCQVLTFNYEPTKTLRKWRTITLQDRPRRVINQLRRLIRWLGSI